MLSTLSSLCKCHCRCLRSLCLMLFTMQSNLSSLMAYAWESTWLAQSKSNKSQSSAITTCLKWSFTSLAAVMWFILLTWLIRKRKLEWSLSCLIKRRWACQPLSLHLMPPRQSLTCIDCWEHINWTNQRLLKDHLESAKQVWLRI